MVKFKDAAMLDVANCAGLMTESVLTEREDEKRTKNISIRYCDIILCQVTLASLTRLLPGCVWAAGRESIQQNTGSNGGGVGSNVVVVVVGHGGVVVDRGLLMLLLLLLNVLHLLRVQDHARSGTLNTLLLLLLLLLNELHLLRV